MILSSNLLQRRQTLVVGSRPPIGNVTFLSVEVHFGIDFLDAWRLFHTHSPIDVSARAADPPSMKGDEPLIWPVLPCGTLYPDSQLKAKHPGAIAFGTRNRCTAPTISANIGRPGVLSVSLGGPIIRPEVVWPGILARVFDTGAGPFYCKRPGCQVQKRSRASRPCACLTSREL
jgi:hypothetical protein